LEGSNKSLERLSFLYYNKSVEIGKLDIKQDIFLDIIKKYDLEKVYVFGSVLREDFTEKSDLDLLIVFRNGKEKSLFDLIDLKNELEDLVGRKVDIVEEEALINPYRKEEILKNAKVIYAA